VPPFDPNAFHDFEQRGWERASEHYGDLFGSLTAQLSDALLDAAGVMSGTRVLDVCTGPGFIAGAATARGATVVGVDFSSAMVADAARRHPAVTFRQGDAEALPFDAGTFDAIVMSFGLLHLARPDAALAEAHRALRAGGRYALTVWAAPEQAVGFGMALKAIEEHGNPNVGLPEGPPFFRFSAADELCRTLAATGFGDIHVETRPLVWRLASPDALFEALLKGGVRIAAVLRAQTPDALTAIRTAVRRGVEGYAKDGAYLIPMPAVLAAATKPGAGPSTGSP
jgi:SAM-dependent methyltransferase